MKPPSPCPDSRKRQLPPPFPCLPRFNIVAAKVAPYFNQRFPPKSFRSVTQSALHFLPSPLLGGKTW